MSTFFGAIKLFSVIFVVFLYYSIRTIDQAVIINFDSFMPEMYLNVDWEDNSNNIMMLWVDNSKHIDVIQGICLPTLAVKL